MLVDTHCHVHFNAFKDDMNDVVRSALAKDVAMIAVGTQATTSANGVALAERYDHVWAAVGLHPSHLLPGHVDEEEVRFRSRNETFDADYYRELLRHPKTVALGEMGLDYYREHPELGLDEQKEIQKKAVTAGVRLAQEEGLPVIMHCRDAHEDMAEILSGLYGPYISGDPVRGVIHCFTGTIDDAQRYFDLGFYISFTGIVTFPPRKRDLEEGRPNLQDVARWAPLDRILVETDAPYLAPTPVRGKRNLPEYVKYVAQEIAELKGISFNEVTERTTENARRLFRKMELSTGA